MITLLVPKCKTENGLWSLRCLKFYRFLLKKYKGEAYLTWIKFSKWAFYLCWSLDWHFCEQTLDWTLISEVILTQFGNTHQWMQLRQKSRLWCLQPVCPPQWVAGTETPLHRSWDRWRTRWAQLWCRLQPESLCGRSGWHCPKTRKVAAPRDHPAIWQQKQSVIISSCLCLFITQKTIKNVLIVIFCF